MIAIEIDPLLAGALPDTVARLAPDRADALTVITADALRVDELPEPPTEVVANLPYNVSVPVLLHLLATFDSWRHGLVMVQSEVADRLVAGPGSKTYGIPSVKLAWYAVVAPGRQRRAERVLAGAQCRFRPGRAGPPGAGRDHRRPRGRCSR